MGRSLWTLYKQYIAIIHKHQLGSLHYTPSDLSIYIQDSKPNTTAACVSIAKMSGWSWNPLTIFDKHKSEVLDIHIMCLLFPNACLPKDGSCGACVPSHLMDPVWCAWTATQSIMKNVLEVQVTRTFLGVVVFTCNYDLLLSSKWLLHDGMPLLNHICSCKQFCFHTFHLFLFVSLFCFRLSWPNRLIQYLTYWSPAPSVEGSDPGYRRAMYRDMYNIFTERGIVKNLSLLRRPGNNCRPLVNAVMCDNIYSDICMIIHASTL